jgi:prophage DNA circulation protein
MGWETDLQDASFRGIEFECVSTNDSANKALAVKQPPYSSDAIVEDMGVDPRKISLRIFLSGEDYKQWLDALEAAFNITGAGELVHPVYGIKNAQVANWSVAHDAENIDTCSIDVDFVVAKAEKKELFVPVKQPEKIQLTYITRWPAEAVQAELEQLKEADPNKFLTTVQTIRNGLQATRKIMGVVRTTADNILSPPDWAAGIVDDVSRLVTFDVSDISAMQKWRSLVDRVHRVGAVFDDEDNDSLVHQPSFKQLWRSITAASVVATSQGVVTNVRSEMAQNNNNAAMTPPELAVIRQQVRRDIQAAIVIERSITPEQAAAGNIDPARQVAVYKTVADQVHQQIQALIETRPPISSSTIILPCTMHWLAHQLYGDMTRANEVKRLNPSLLNPAALQPGMELVSYAQ